MFLDLLLKSLLLTLKFITYSLKKFITHSLILCLVLSRISNQNPVIFIEATRQLSRHTYFKRKTEGWIFISEFVGSPNQEVVLSIRDAKSGPSASRSNTTVLVLNYPLNRTLERGIFVRRPRKLWVTGAAFLCGIFRECYRRSIVI